MATTFTNLTTANSTTDATSFNTASIAPTSGNLVLVTVTGVATNNVNPTLTGHSLTWDTVDTAGGAGTDVTGRVMRTFKTVSDGTSGALTIDWGATTQARCFWSVTEVTAPYNIIQSVDSVRNNGGGAITTYSVTLESFAQATNSTYGAIHNSGVAAITPGSGFTELGDTTVETQVLETEYKTSADTSVDWSFASNDSQVLAIALEIGSIPSSFFMMF